jgi:hypothetical protein
MRGKFAGDAGFSLRHQEEKIMKAVGQTMFAAVALCAVFASTTIAAPPPKPPADCGLDADHDGWCVKDPDRSDKLVGVEDCNDADSKVNPGAIEIIGDEIDQDCVGGDLTAPAYARNFGCFDVACLKRMNAEIANCEADAAKCVVNYSAGKFVLSWGNYFVDTDCNGVRGVIDQDGKDTHDDEVRKGKTCHRASVKPSRSGTVVGDVKKKSSAPAKPDPKVAEPDGKVTDLTGRVEQTESVLVDTTKRLDDMGVVVADHETRIDAVEGRLDGYDSELQEVHKQVIDVDGAVRDVESKVQKVRRAALRRGVSAGVTVGYLVKGQQAVTFKGQTLRGDSAHGVEIRGFVGAEIPSLVLRGVGSIAVLAEDGPDGVEQALGFRGGGEVLMKVSSSFACGVGAGYLGQISGGKVSGATAESRGGYLEVPCELSLGKGSLRVPFRLAPFVGFEAIGTKGDSASGEFRADGSSWFVGVTLAVGVGVGSAMR